MLKFSLLQNLENLEANEEPKNFWWKSEFTFYGLMFGFGLGILTLKFIKISIRATEVFFVI